jgi:hypothetical protein
MSDSNSTNESESLQQQSQAVNADQTAVANANEQSAVAATATSSTSAAVEANAPLADAAAAATANYVPPVIVEHTLNEVIDASGVRVTNEQGRTADDAAATRTTMVTTVVEDVDVKQDLSQQIVVDTDDSSDTPESLAVMAEIRTYAAKINCESFQGKGTIEDYSELFVAASKIATETKQMKLAVDVSGFNDFAAAADELSELFSGFITKLQTITIVDDLDFLKSIRAAMAKIANLADVFGKFKKTILATARVDIPKSARDARLVIEDVFSEVNCAMQYVNHFVTPVAGMNAAANLSDNEKAVIDKAVSTIENWSALCEQDVSVSMSNSADIAYVKNVSSQLQQKASALRQNTSALRAKLAAYRNF